MIRNTTLRASVSLAGMAFGMALSLPGGAAHAQTAPEAADRGITEIIVTANRREEGIPLLEEKFRRNLARRFPAARQAAILAVAQDQATLEAMPVRDFMDLLVPA